MRTWVLLEEVNLGIIKALNDGSKIILLLNNDTVVSPDLISDLLPALQEPGAGIVGPAISYYDEPDKIWIAGGGYSQMIGYSYRIRPLAPFDGYHNVDWISGCALLAKREVFEKVGLFWEPFFLNCEAGRFLPAGSQSKFQVHTSRKTTSTSQDISKLRYSWYR